MTAFPFESRTIPCRAAFLGALWPGSRCGATDCWSALGVTSALMPAPGAGAAHNKLSSQHRLTGCEKNLRDAMRIPSGPGLPASYGEKKLETSGDHGFFRSRQVAKSGSAHTIRCPIFALFNHDCTTHLQNH